VNLMKEILSNLVSLKELLELLAIPLIKEKVEKLASTSQRRKMWILSNGENSTRGIAQKVKVSNRSIRYFVNEGRKAGIIITVKRGYPKRKIDYIPEDWKEFQESL